ncbi:unnamed protein product [Mytilus coruscus]|uniref:Uncharacterized protein n=1 Tax=Mytilus coruscus TaxID=42192 RepID=A0A6J8A2I5_MYTCO|nr:unnamed protein product [Mytilus coruscus]
MAYIRAPLQPQTYLQHVSESQSSNTTVDSSTSSYSEQVPVRQSTRNKKPPAKFNDFVNLDSELGTESISSDDNRYHKIKRVLARKIDNNQLKYLVQIVGEPAQNSIWVEESRWLPGPLISGGLIDSTCLVWKESCGVRGSCAIYDNDVFRLKLHGYSLIGRLMVIVIFCYCCFYTRKMITWKTIPQPVQEEVTVHFIPQPVEEEVAVHLNGKEMNGNPELEFKPMIINTDHKHDHKH